MHAATDFLARYRQALTLFVAGRFVPARALLEELLAERPQERALWEKRIQLDLLDNRPAEALAALRQVDDPGEPQWPGLWAVAHLRQGQYRAAAPHFDRLGQSVRAAVLARLDDQRPADPRARIRVPFRFTHPLPVVAATLEDEEEALLALDTGAGETLLDAGLARRLGLRLGGTTRARFAGGLPAEVRYGVLEEVRFGTVTLGPLPVQVMDMQAALPGFFGPHGVDGLLGLQALWRHDLALDFPGGCLELAPPGQLGLTDADSSRCWLAGEAHLVARGTLNDASLMWFLDSGMADFECLLPEPTVAAWRLPVSEATHQAWGGGGVVEVRTLHAERLCLAGACRRDVRGVVLPQFPLETAYGFHLAGIVGGAFLSHFRLELDCTRMHYRLLP